MTPLPIARRYAKVRGHLHYIAVVHRGARLEEGRHCLLVPHHRREGHPAIPATHPAALSIVHGGADRR